MIELQPAASLRDHDAGLLDLRGVATLLCDADGTLFPSEEPAYEASARVTQAFAHRYGLAGDFSAENLRRIGTGRNFRSLSADLLAAASREADPQELAEWIAIERRAVTAHLAATLTPIDEVRMVTAGLRRRYQLAIVSSSASTRVLACLAASGLDATFPAAALFSAEDSLPQPVSKPDPTVYCHALAELAITAEQSLALEDSTAGVASAVAAGIRTIGIVQFVPPAERGERAAELRRAGALTVVEAWSELPGLLQPRTVAAAAERAPWFAKSSTAAR